MIASSKIRVGLYGANGHQLYALLQGHPDAEVTGYAGCELPGDLPAGLSLTRHDSLDALANDSQVDLISLCSPRRADQANDAILCLQRGKHVYAEKPCALNEPDLDRILSAAQTGGKQFREMAGTALENPYPSMRDVVRSGALGEVVQVFAQKSYPYHGQRPQEERVDGGLILQVGIHATRLIEQVAGVRIQSLDLLETTLGNPLPGELKMAAVLQGRLENGGLVSIVLNYLNPRGLGVWGNDHLRIFGTRGMIESVNGGQRTACVIENAPAYAVAMPDHAVDHATSYFRSLLEGAPMPVSLEDELRPLRVLLKVKSFSPPSSVPTS